MGDIVDIAAGRVKGKSGTVKFIHRQGLFLHVRYLVFMTRDSNFGLRSSAAAATSMAPS